MSTTNIIRAWKDEDYRLGLTAEESEVLPGNPSGAIQLQSLNSTRDAQVPGQGHFTWSFCHFSRQVHCTR